MVNIEATKRNPVYDIAKFMVMLFVVAGHLTGNHIVARDSGVSYLSNMNIGVAMPLFFMISGYFAVKVFDSGDVAKIVARIVGFLWPLAAFGIIFGLILFLSGKIPLWKGMLYPLARVCGGSWFLKTLAIIYATVSVVWRLIKSIRWRIVALLGIYAILFFTAGQGGVIGVIGLPSVLHMFPYFVFGVLALKPFGLYDNWRMAIPSGIFFLLVVFLEGDVRSNGMGFYWTPSDWQTIVADKRLFFCFWARPVVGIAGSIFTLWVVDKMLKIVPKISRLAVFGTTTLGVYVMHEWPLVQMHKYWAFEPLSSAWRWPLTLVLFLVCHGIAIWVKGNSKLKFFFFGDEKWLSRKISKVLNKVD